MFQDLPSSKLNTPEKGLKLFPNVERLDLKIKIRLVLLAPNYRVWPDVAKREIIADWIEEKARTFPSRIPPPFRCQTCQT